MDRVVVDLSRRKSQNIRFQTDDLHLFLHVSSERECRRSRDRSGEREKGSSIHAQNRIANKPPRQAAGDPGWPQERSWQDIWTNTVEYQLAGFLATFT